MSTLMCRVVSCRTVRERVDEVEPISVQKILSPLLAVVVFSFMLKGGALRRLNQRLTEERVFFTKLGEGSEL